MFHVHVSAPELWCCACWLTLNWMEAIINVISSSCTFPAAPSQNVCLRGLFILKTADL